MRKLLLALAALAAAKLNVEAVRVAAEGADHYHPGRRGRLMLGPQTVLAEFPASSMGQLNRNPEDLKDRLVLNFKKDQVAKVIFHAADGKQLAVERSRTEDGGSGESWEVVAPRAAPASGAARPSRSSPSSGPCSSPA